MEQVINYRDPSFFREIEFLLAHRLHAKLACDGVLELIFEHLRTPYDNKDVSLLLHLSKQAFDPSFIQLNSISFIETVGAEARNILQIIEKLRFELKLLDNERFEIDFSTLAFYLEFLTETNQKLEEIKLTYEGDLKFLMN